jgi:hypothetical protein
MNIKTVLIALIAALVIGGGIWWFTGNGDNDSASMSGQETSNLSQAASINELLAQNQNLMCTFSDTDDQGNASSGTVYLAGGRMSGDFSLRAPGEDAINSHVINDGQNQYAWQEGENEGVKISLEQIAANQPSQDTQNEETSSNVNQDEDYNFECQEWNVDESRFSPPGNVNFIDYSQQIQEAQQAQQQNSQASEEACAQISDAEARAACEASL